MLLGAKHETDMVERSIHLYDGSDEQLIRYRELELLDSHGQMKNVIFHKGKFVKFISQMTDIMGLSHKQIAERIAEKPENFFSKEPYFCGEIEMTLEEWKAK